MTNPSDKPIGRVRLVRGREQGIQAGSLWIFAGQIDAVRGDPRAGDVVDVYVHSGRFFGRGFFNPKSKIRVRLLTFRDEPIDESFWTARIAAPPVAWRRRRKGRSPAA